MTRLSIMIPGAVRAARAALIASGLAAALACAGCSAKAHGDTVADATPAVSASPSDEVPAPAAPAYSVLSGRHARDGRVLVVKIDNTTRAHPQAGVRSADVVYVEPVEGGLTRLAAVFSSTIPAAVGPVRSARESDLDLFAQYGHVGFAFSGVQNKLLRPIADADLVPLSFDAGAKGFYRQKGRSAPYNVFADPHVLLAQATKAVPAHDVGFAFGPAPAGGTPTSRVRASWVDASSTFTWSASRAAWLWAADGVPAYAAEGGRLSATTVLVQYVDVVASHLHDVNQVATPLAVTTGSGTAVMLRGGRSWPIEWSRGAPTSPTLWTDESGAPVSMAPGQVWVLLVDKHRVVRLTSPAP